MRPRPGLGVKLDGASAQLGILQALDGLVVERDVRRLARLAGRDREAVVLAGDEDATRSSLDDWMVCAAVPERELERLVARGESEQLVSEADPEDRDPTY